MITKLVCLLLLTLAAQAETFTVTAYCNNFGKGCKTCNGKWAVFNRTADGHRPKEGVTCAASRRIPFGTVLSIEGLGVRVVQDRLSLKQDKQHIDIYFDSHQQAKQFGRRQLTVKIAPAKR